MQAVRKALGAFMAIVLAVGLVPAPAFASAGEGLVAAGGGLFVEALPTADYSWYAKDTDATTFEVPNGAGLVGLANLVNGSAPTSVAAGAVSFAGKTVKLTGTANLRNSEWTPIGSKEHPFAGTFDGDGNSVQNFAVANVGRSGYIGLFGYVEGDVSNVVVDRTDSIAVTRAASSTDVVHHVGAVAGYCAGSMSNCTSSATVSVTTAVRQSAAAPQVVYAIGGVAGECSGTMSGCVNNGAVSVTASAPAGGGVSDAGLVRYVGGVAGVSGDSSRIGTASAPIEAAATHAEMAGCKNLAQVTVETPSAAGTDRFGMTAYALSVGVGGVVGYAQGDVTGCANGEVGSYYASSTGYVRAEHGTQVGGIAGALRATPSTGNDMGARGSADDGSAGDDPLSTAVKLADCTNYGDVYALATVGGIVGAAGSYTTVTACTNALKRADTVTNAQPTYVVATRWNKPAPAGIAGSTCGTVSYCANFATVESGTWKVEKNRTLNQGSGYFASGLVGSTSYFTKTDEAGATVRTTPLPEVYGCYNAGYVSALSGNRQCGLVSVNNGTMHDNVLRRGMVEGDALFYEKDSTGTQVRNTVLDDAALRGKTAVAALNGACDAEGWVNNWVASTATATNDPALNLGFPVLTAANPVAEGDRTSVAGASFAFAPASYTGGAAVPNVDENGLELGGATLVRNADYRVVPEAGKTEIGSGYAGEVRGIGQYAGTASGTYSIAKGKLSECTVTVESATFDYSGHSPFKADSGAAGGPGLVTVTTPGGVVVDPSEYDIEKVVLRKAGSEIETTPVDASTNYFVTVKAKSGSEHFETAGDEASATGQFRVEPANLQTDADYSAAKVAWSGVSAKWISSGDEANTAAPTTTFAYTGLPVKPAVSGIAYKGHALVEGKDYRVVYGNPNPITSGGESYDANNVGSAAGSAVGCVTVRYFTGGNFTNYQNMFFTIRNGLAGAKVSGLADRPYTGGKITPKPTVKVGSATLREGVDYTLSYANNTAIGTATVTITGKGATYGGIAKATFKIVKAANTLTAKAKSKKITVKRSKVKKKSKSYAAKKVFTVAGAQGKVTYKKTKGSRKITVSSAGKVTVKKGCKKGAYSVGVNVTAAGDTTHDAATVPVVFKVRVK